MQGKYEKIKNALPCEVDGVLLTSQVNQYYATGFDFDDGYVLVTKNGSFILCDFRYIEAAQENAAGKDGLEAVLLEKNALCALFSKLGAKNIMYEWDRLSVAAFERLKEKCPLVTFLPEGGMLDTLRAVKDDDEIENIEKAQRIAEKAYASILPLLETNITEAALAFELDTAMRRYGAQRSAFKTIAISGSATSRPHGEPSDRVIEKGFLTMDFGAVFGGYCSDMTRTVYIGCPSDEERNVYNTVLQAQLSALEYLQNGGKSCFFADKCARKIIDVEYCGAFGHSLGHGVGLEIHEAPRLSPNSRNETLKKGNVVTVEPGIYLPSRYGVRIEDMVAVTEKGVINLTKQPKELIEIR